MSTDAVTQAVFDDVDEAVLRRRRTIKWSMYGPDVLAAWVAEMDFPTAPVIQQAILAAAEREQYGYPVLDGQTGLPEAVAAWSSQHYGQRIDPARVHVLGDVLKGVELAIRYYSPADSPVILPTPAYMPFFDVPRAVGRNIIEVPLRYDGARYRLDLDAIAAAFAGGAGSMILCQPYNPVGRVFDRTELAALADVVDAHGGRVVSDEIHAPLTYDAPHVPYATVSAAAAAHTITMTSATKAWNLPGLKCAVAITSNHADEAVWQAIPVERTHGVSTFGIEASVAAFTAGRPWLTAALSYLDTTRTWFAGLLAEQLPGVAYRPPEGTYFAWLDCRALELPTEPSAFFLDRAKVAVNPGPAFGAPGEGFVRLNLATSRPMLERIVQRMADAVALR